MPSTSINHFLVFVVAGLKIEKVPCSGAVLDDLMAFTNSEKIYIFHLKHHTTELTIEILLMFTLSLNFKYFAHIFSLFIFFQLIAKNVELRCVRNKNIILKVLLLQTLSL